MKLRCKVGDLAIVIYDRPPCTANIGRIVQVRRTRDTSSEEKLRSWHIKPVHAAPFLIRRGQKVASVVVDWESLVTLPDAWLAPLACVKDQPDCVSAHATCKVPPAKPVPVTSMRYRPRSYFEGADLQTELMARVKGVMRRSALQELLDQGWTADIPDFLSKPALEDAERMLSGRLHPMFMGGEYLPTVPENDAEIARICINSTTYDVTSLYASKVGQRIRYRMVDEYQGETLRGRVTRTSLRPLSMGQMIKFFLDSWNLYRCLECNYEGDLEGMLGFFHGESEYYPCFDEALRDLVKRKFFDKEESK